MLWACKSDTAVEESNIQYSDDGIAELSKQIAKDSTSDKLYYERGAAYYKLENYDGAIHDLIQAINLDSLQYPYYHLLSDVLLDYYRSKEAVLTMERCVELLPDSRISMLKLSELYLILKQYDDSMALCNRLLYQDQQDEEAYFMLGMNFRAKGEIDKAINAFQTATELEPDLVDAWLLLGQLYEQLGDPIAIDYYNSAVNVNPENVAALHSKAFYLQNSNKIKEAIDLYREISVLDKYYTDAYLNCGILYMAIDSTERALEQFDIMAKTKPDSPAAYYYRGLAYQDLGEIEAAKENFTTALNLNPDYTKAKSALKALEEN
ncbi:tetratricopeptide repeat protein [Saprospiraceae bacterium]|nr:tetratricopeptide repeat protein [Saprospiraceae bacterium]